MSLPLPSSEKSENIDIGAAEIGLAVVQRIIHRHGGKLRAGGKLGEGAVFSFTLRSQIMPTL